MSDELIELEEEEHTSQLTSPVFKRIVGLLKPHWKWVVGFLVTIMLTSIMDAYFTYLNKQIVDVGIPLMIFMAVQFRKKILVEYRVTRHENSKITGAFNENFQGVRRETRYSTRI